ncbi:MAG: hypothetical protein KF819_30390 [Labilithrix sp.]|nr:hypothetical protein [Labilithrix sp.]
MTPRGLLRLFAIYGAALVVACVAMRAHTSLRELGPAERAVIVSAWKEGKLVAREVRPPHVAGQDPPRAGNASDGRTVVEEIAVAEGPLTLTPLLFQFSLVQGRDGVRAELGGKTAWVTVDDLLSTQAYDHATTFFDPSLGMGTHHATVVHLLAQQLGVSTREVEENAAVRRVRFERRIPGVVPRERITKDSVMRRELVIEAVRSAAEYITRGTDAQGRFRYLVDATTNTTLTGYNWPRHSGTTYFLAQAAALLDDPEIRAASLRAAACLRDEMMKDCGAHKCIVGEGEADVGSSALAVVAFAEIVRTGADASYRRAIAELTAFLRSQQRPDGELMHLYDRSANKPLDMQFLYYTGEASLALARAHRVTGDPEDLRAASAALRRLSTEGWTFFGSRYYFSEEHWTCQAMADLWDRAPDEDALAFCLRWHEFQRRLQHEDGDSPFDADGGFGFSPFVIPRITPASSRGEAAVAALEVVKRTRRDDEAAELLDDQLRRALAYVLRSQLDPGPRHLFARPDEARGAMPGSPVDLQLRIDFVQHAGSMMVRWLELEDALPTK